MVSSKEVEKWRTEWDKELAERQERMDEVMWKSFDNYPELKAIFTRDKSKPADPNLILSAHNSSTMVAAWGWLFLTGIMFIGSVMGICS